MKKFKRHKPLTKCKCYLCGIEGHYAGECKNCNVKKERLNLYQNLELQNEIDIVSIASSDSENDSDVCSIYEDDGPHFEEEINYKGLIEY